MNTNQKKNKKNKKNKDERKMEGLNNLHLTLSPIPASLLDSRNSTLSPTPTQATPAISSPLPSKQSSTPSSLVIRSDVQPLTQQQSSSPALVHQSHSPTQKQQQQQSQTPQQGSQQQTPQQIGQGDDPLGVKTLPYDIVIITVRSLLPCVGAILHAAMFKQNRFVYVSQIEHRNTLILDAQTFKELPRGLVTTLSDRWKGFEIFAGSETLSKPGVVSETTSKLCSGDIPYIYVSVWTSDFVLVPAAHYHKAIGVLGSGISLRDYGNGEEYDYEAETVTNRSLSGSSTVIATQDIVNRDLHIGFLSRREFRLKTYELLETLFAVMDTDRTFAFGSMSYTTDYDDMSTSSYEYSPSTGIADDYYGEEDSRSVSLSMLEGTGDGDDGSRLDETLMGGITLVLDRKANDGLGLSMKEMDGWAAIRISNSNPLRPISEPVSGTLAAVKIPILFMGTTLYDYVLVPDDKIQKATEALGKLFESLMK